MPFAPYVGTVEFRDHLGIKNAEFDPMLDDVAISVTRWVDEFCQRHFWQDGAIGSEVARTFAASNPWCLNFGPFNDLVSITELATDEAGDGTFETTWAASDYQLQPVNQPTGRPFTSIEAVAGRLFPVRWWPEGRGDRVQVTGVWGWAAVPDAVYQATLIQAARVFKRKDAPEGVVGFDQFGTIRVSSRPDPDVEALLSPYRRVVALVA